MDIIDITKIPGPSNRGPGSWQYVAGNPAPVWVEKSRWRDRLANVRVIAQTMHVVGRFVAWLLALLR